MLYQGELYYIDITDIDPVKQSFLWNAGERRGEKAEGLIFLREIQTRHSFTFEGFFKPSMAEVWGSIPDDIRDQVVAFETNIIDTDIRYCCDFDTNEHIALTRLYTK